MTDGAIPPLQDSAKVTTEINPEGPGPRLKAAREAANLQIKDIALHMRLSPTVITQIDQDIYDPEIALVFMRGYLRSYAKLVGLNADEVIAEFNALGHEEERDISQLVTRPAPKIRNMPNLNVQARPGIFWGSAAVLAMAFVAMLWAHTTVPGGRLSAQTIAKHDASVIANEVEAKVAEETQSEKPAQASEQVASQEAKPAPAKAPSQPQPAADSEESLLF